MSKKAYMVVLSGQGDTYTTYVNEDTWNWINNETTKVPEGQITRQLADVHNDMTREEIIESFNAWRGSSPDNDRALNASADFGDTFFTMKDAMKFARDNDLEIVDSFEGYIY